LRKTTFKSSLFLNLATLTLVFPISITKLIYMKNPTFSRIKFNLKELILFNHLQKIFLLLQLNLY
jgi:hypothetical protein